MTFSGPVPPVKTDEPDPVLINDNEPAPPVQLILPAVTRITLADAPPMTTAMPPFSLSVRPPAPEITEAVEPATVATDNAPAPPVIPSIAPAAKVTVKAPRPPITVSEPPEDNVFVVPAAVIANETTEWPTPVVTCVEPKPEVTVKV